MKPILRKLRMEMSATDKIRHYLAYAIGEILLIVIGILIAVQLSNLNDERRAWNAATWNASRLMYAPTLRNFRMIARPNKPATSRCLAMG